MREFGLTLMLLLIGGSGEQLRTCFKFTRRKKKLSFILNNKCHKDTEEIYHKVLILYDASTIATCNCYFEDIPADKQRSKLCTTISNIRNFRCYRNNMIYTLAAHLRHCMSHVASQRSKIQKGMPSFHIFLQVHQAHALIFRKRQYDPSTT